MGRINGFAVGGAIGFADGVSVSVPGVSSIDTLIDSIFIPGGTFRAGDVILIQASCIRSSTSAGNMNVRLYWNETDDIITSPTLIGVVAGSTTDEYCPIYRNVAIVGNTTTIVINTGTTFETDLTDNEGSETSSGPSTITAINWNLDGYIIVSASNGTNTTITKNYLTIIR